MDAAFKTAAYPGYTTNQLREIMIDGRGNNIIAAEIIRREKAIAGDISVMTVGERLRFLRTGKPR